MLEDFDVLIGYSPLGDEPGYGAYLTEKNIAKHGISVLADRSLSPQAGAQSLMRLHTGKKVAIFVPGREFDLQGTRHGRGGGWYDRFLAAVPREWLRIGVLNAAQLSQTPLKREPWDEPMDTLLVRDEGSWKILKVER